MKMLFNGGIVFSTVEEVIEIEDLKCQMFWRENMIYFFRLHKLEIWMKACIWT